MNQELSKIGRRGSLAELLTVTASDADIAHHCRIVLDHATRRRLIALAYEINQRAHSSAALEPLLREAEQALFQAGSSERTWCSLADVAHETMDYVDRVHKQKDRLIGIPTGFDDRFVARRVAALGFRNHRSPHQHGENQLRAGFGPRCSSGGLRRAQEGFYVGMLSLEMSRLQLGLRLHRMGAPIPARRF